MLEETAMKRIFSVFVLALVIVVMTSCGEKSARVTVRNPAGFERKGETVTVPLRTTGGEALWTDGANLTVVDPQTETVLPSQREGDSLLFQTDFMPGEKKEFLVRPMVGAATKGQSLVDGRFEPPREDYAWENDRIAFRMYGPALAAEVSNGIDVWTKRVRKLIVDKWYSESAAAGKDTYHEDHGEGADFFSVGRSLGAGACGLWLNDAVRQPGVFSSYKSISNGPVRVTFELIYRNWKVGGVTLTEHMRVSLDAGANLNRIELVFDGIGVNDSLQVACGLVKRSNTTVSRDEKGCWLGLWGLTTPDTVNGSLGTGIVSSSVPFARFTEDRDQYLVISKVKMGNPFVYYAGAGWTRSGDFATETEWKSYLSTFAQRQLFPLEVSIHLD